MRNYRKKENIRYSYCENRINQKDWRKNNNRNANT